MSAAACTIVTRSYLSYALVLAESYLRHHPGARVYVLVVDGVPRDAPVQPGVILLDPTVLALPYFRELAFKYEPAELATAVKPTLLAHLLSHEPTLVYLDPDVLVLQPFDALEQVLERAAVVLTPHSLAPYPDDGLRPNEQGMLVTGVFNLGFLAVRRTREVDAMLAWWESRLRDGAAVDLAAGSFTDQKWADLVPAYVASMVVLRDPGYNVAYWNLHERPLQRVGDTYVAGDSPVVFFHFSGFDPDDPTTLTRRVRPALARTRVGEGTALAGLLETYAELHRRHGWQTYSRIEYGFARFSNGEPIDPRLRRLYLSLAPEERSRVGDPFRDGWAAPQVHA